MARKRARISKPGEHGGLVIVAASGVAAAILAPGHVLAALAALAGAGGYMARGPVERRVRRFRPRAWDDLALLGYAAAIGAAVFLVARSNVLAAALLGAGIGGLVAIGAIVTALRVHRAMAVELLGLAGCGALAGLFLYAGGGAVRAALGVGAAMAAYGAATVPFVRAEVRELPAWNARAMAWLAVFLLLCGAAAIAAIGPRLWAVAFAPRAAHCAARGVLGAPRPRRVVFIALRETAEVATFVALVCALL